MARQTKIVRAVRNGRWSDVEIETLLTNADRPSDAEVDALIEQYETEDDHERAVTRQLDKLRVDGDARRRYALERVGSTYELPAVGRTLAHSLKEPWERLGYTIDRLHTRSGNTLLVAKYKSGKTTLGINLMRALADHEPFLGEFDVAKLDGRIAIFNHEMTLSMFNEWVEDAGIKHPERIAEPLHLRGRTLPLWDDYVSEDVVRWLRGNEVEFWIIDPAARAWRGIVDSESDNAQIDIFTSVLDQIKHEAGVRDLLLSTHMGREKFDEGEERARGGTRLEDWMDHGWYMGKDSKDGDAPRWLWAEGRDVSVKPPIDLSWDPGRRRLGVTGQTRAERRSREGVMNLLAALFRFERKDDHGEWSKSGELQGEGRINKNQITKVRDEAKREGWIEVREGAGNAIECRLTVAGRERLTDHRVVHDE